jgi:hypothetical protein
LVLHRYYSCNIEAIRITEENISLFFSIKKISYNPLIIKDTGELEENEK